MNIFIILLASLFFTYVAMSLIVLCIWVAEIVHLVGASNSAHRTVNISSNKEKLNFFVTSIENYLKGDTQKIEKIGMGGRPPTYIFYPFIESNQYFVFVKQQGHYVLPLEVDVKTTRVLFYCFTKVTFSDEKPNVVFYGVGHKSEIKRLKNAFLNAKKSFDEQYKKEQFEKFEKHFIDMYTDGL